MTRLRSAGKGRLSGLGQAGGVPPVGAQAEPFQSQPANVVVVGVVEVVGVPDDVGVVVTPVVVVGLVGVADPPPPQPVTRSPALSTAPNSLETITAPM